MKVFYLIGLLFLMSCTNRQDFDNSQKYYFEGLKRLTILDSLKNVNYEKAKESFEKALEIYPKHYEAAYWKAFCELYSKSYNDAIRTSEQYIKLVDESHINKPDLFVVKGIAELKIGKINQSNDDFDRAKKIYENRIEKDAYDKNSLLNYSLILCYQDKKEDAISFLESHKNKIVMNESISEIIEGIRMFDADNFLKEK